jgi:hypothetical protein
MKTVVTVAKRGSVVVLVGAALGAAFACSGPGASSSSDACGVYYDAFGRLLTACETSSSSADTLGARAEFVRFCGIALSAPGTGVTAASLSACAAAINKIPGCPTAKLEEIPECVQPNGSLPAGAACLGSDQCAGGVCSRTTMPVSDAGAPATTGLNCGTCAPTLAEGEACNGSSGVTCARRLSCLNGKCAKVPTTATGVAEGGICFSQDANGQTTQSSCASGLTCETQLDPATNKLTGTCKKRPGKGEACTTSCATGFVCANKVCVERAGEGGACPVGNECKAGLACDQASKTCKGPTIVNAGGDCAKSGVKCASGLQCTSSGSGNPTCQAPIAENGACDATASRCDRYLKCIDGKCIFPDANQCK